MKSVLGILSLCIAAFLSGCGGGGGGGGGGTPGTDTPLALGSYVGVGQAGGDLMVDAGASATGFGGAADSSGIGVVSPGSLQRIVMRSVQRAAADVLSTREHPQESSSTSQNCSYSGSIALITNDNNNNGVFDIGDSLVFGFLACTFVEGEPGLWGHLTLTISGVTGTGPGATVTMNVRYDNLGLIGSQMSGNATVAATLDRMVFTFNGVTASRGSRQVTYYHTMDINIGSEEPTATFSGNVVFGGAGFSLSTRQTIVLGNLYPKSGILRVTDKRGGYVDLTAGSTTLTVDLYLPGDAVRDGQTIFNWVDLLWLS